jgi:hypothetical protein
MPPRITKEKSAQMRESAIRAGQSLSKIGEPKVENSSLYVK